MTSSWRQSIEARAPKRWGPTWARVLAWVALVPSAWGMFFGVAYFVLGFGDDAMAALGLLLGPVLALLALAVAVPAVMFLVRRGKTPFTLAMCMTPVLLAAVVLLTF